MGRKEERKWGEREERVEKTGGGLVLIYIMAKEEMSRLVSCMAGPHISRITQMILTEQQIVDMALEEIRAMAYLFI